MPPALLKEVEKTKMRDRRSLSYDFKMDVIKRLESGVHRSVVCKEFGLADSTIRHILKASDKIKNIASDKKSSDVYYSKPQIFNALDNLLYDFITEAKTKHDYVSSKMVCDEAKRLFYILKQDYKGPKHFYATKPWYNLFIQRAKKRNITLSNSTVTSYDANTQSSHEEDIQTDQNIKTATENVDSSRNEESQDAYDDEYCPLVMDLEGEEQVPLDGMKLTPKIVEDAIHHIETAFELLERYDDNWQRVSIVRRKIHEAISSYKDMLISSREKTKQNSIYDVLKFATQKQQENSNIDDNT